MNLTLQKQYEIIYSFFKTTTEPFDELDWNGYTLSVILNEKVIEEYTFSELTQFIVEFNN